MRSRADAAIVAVVLGAAIAIGLAVWIASGMQAQLTERASERQAAGAALLSGMLDQETSMRGFIGNGRREFLTPFRSGRRAFARALRDSRRLARGDRRGLATLAEAETRARRWRSLARRAIAKTRRDGRRSTTVASALERKAAMDRFRRSQRAYARWANVERGADVARARRHALLVVLALGLMFSVAGVFVVRWVRRVRAARERRYQHLVRSLPDAGVLTFDLDLRFTSADGAALEAMGWGEPTIVGKHLNDVVSPIQYPSIEAPYRAVLDGETKRFEYGSSTTGRCWAVEVSPLRRDDGEILGGVVLMRDVTERQLAEREAEQRTRDLEALSRAAHDLASSESAGEAQRAIRDAAHTLAGATATVVWLPEGRGRLSTGCSLGLRGAPEAVTFKAAATEGATASDERAEPVLVTERAGDAGADRLLELVGCSSVYYVPIVDDGQSVGVVAVAWADPIDTVPDRVRQTLALICSDGAVALDRIALLQRLADLARTDPLTGLANRRGWDERFDVELARVKRSGEPLGVAILDIDHFKAFNDGNGHDAGDRLLRELAAAFTAEVRATDLVARLGGEEFGVLLPQSEAQDTEELLGRMRAVVPDGQTCSAGYAIWRPGETGAEVLKRADDALYQAKRAGRDRAYAAVSNPAV